MNMTQGSGKRMKSHNVPAVRASISFPPGLYEMLEGIAKEKKVSLAWVVVRPHLYSKALRIG